MHLSSSGCDQDPPPRPDNTAACTAYLSWGWYKIGELQPFDDAPVFDAMVLDPRK